MDERERLTQVFFDVQRGLPRQGIGSDAVTLRALALCPGLADAPDVLDIGCGPGMQTVALARALPEARITAVDAYPEFLDELRARAEGAGVHVRIEIVRGDMADLPYADASFDLVWCEGAAYIMGVPAALAAWRRLLRPGGCLALSEIVWTRLEPPAELLEFFRTSYEGMTDIDGNLARFGEAGYEVVGHFTLPDSAWWADYLAPLEAKLPGLHEKYAGDEAALAVIEATRLEIGLRRRHPDAYGYEFFVARLGT